MSKTIGKILITDDNKDIHDDIKYILDSPSGNEDDFQETRFLKEELFGKKSAAHADDKVINIKYRIDDAFQGEEAINMVRAAKNAGDPYSLIFMDVRMPPGIDGIETIERIWEIDPDVGVVICTAYSDYSWNQIVSKLGQNDNLLFIRKPFDNVSLKQIALAMTTKWRLKIQVNEYIENLENQVEKRTNELSNTVKMLKKEIALRREKEKQLAHNAHYDALTELLNRRSFYSMLSRINSGELLNNDKFSLFYIDLDNFKNVNDILGHDIGDKLLIEAAERIKNVLESHACLIPDFVGENGMVRAIFRIGGDEFTALVKGNDAKEIGKIAQSLIDAIREPYFISGYEIGSSCSIGISIYQQDNIVADRLLKYADMALYEAKKVNAAYRFYNKSELFDYRKELQLEKDLIKAIEKNQIDVLFQRLVNARNEVIGVQSLARWHHPEFGELDPDQFIHVAQKSDLIIEVGNYILRKSIHYMSEIHKAGYDNLFLLVNCTTKEFYNPGFRNNVVKALKDFGLDPAFLKLNLDDKYSFQATPGALAIIRELNSIGVHFALSGFDSEYPSFAFLQQLPRNTVIKLNKAYVEDISRDPKKLKFLYSLMDIIRTWDLDIIVSGVETQEQRRLLAEKDCILQCFRFDAPKPFNRFMEELKAGE